MTTEIAKLKARVKTLEKLLYILIITDEVGYKTKDFTIDGTGKEYLYDNLSELLSNYMTEKQNEEFESAMANLESQLDLPKDEQAFA